MPRWKQHERDVAALLGGHRNANNGQRQTDIEAGPWAIEHKTRQDLPQWFTRMMEQAVAGAKPGKTPLAVIDLCAGRGHKTERFVVLRFSDFQDWHGKLSQSEPE